MPVAVIDIGTNSTRLLIAEVDRSRGSVCELLRRSRVTRLGDGLESTGSLSDAAVGRVMETLREYRRAMDEHDVRSNLAVLTSAVRDAANGEQFAARVRSEFELDAHVLAGEEEAQLTFLGAMSDQANGGGGQTVEAVVIDIGGGSTEFIVGSGRTASYHVSLPLGVVRMSERHIHSDPPARAELDALASDAREVLAERLSPEAKTGVGRGIAVAGMIVLGDAMRAFELDRVEVSEHDILHGGALRLAGLG